MMNKILMIVVIVMSYACGHTHEHSETMKEVIKMNTSLWEDLNSSKNKVNSKIREYTSLAGELDSLRKAEISAQLPGLLNKKAELAKLDALIPELEGYEPKCNHEPGEAHSHNSVKLDGVPEEELLEIHKELARKLAEIKNL